jgi:signal transduction histidine kinase
LKIAVDAAFFRQVIANLVSNAIKYSNPDDVVVCSSKQKELIVSDNGIGIPEEMKHDDLFNGEYLKSIKGTKGEKGTGIGLSICKKILDAHGFGIHYTPEENGGSNFIISLS